MKRTAELKRTPMKPGTKPLQARAQMARSQARMRTSKPVKRRTPKNAPTAAEGRYMGLVAALSCALCRRLGYGPTPAEVHHPRRGSGMGARSSHYDTIPLCPEHHRGNTGIHGMGVKAFMAYYEVSEADLTAETRALLAQHLPQ